MTNDRNGRSKGMLCKGPNVAADVVALSRPPAPWLPLAKEPAWLRYLLGGMGGGCMAAGMRIVCGGSKRVLPRKQSGSPGALPTGGGSLPVASAKGAVEVNGPSQRVY
jgi:hypothetical protein